MAMVKWSEEYSVNFPEIDEQHRCIVNYINELYAALAKKESRLLVTEVLNKLVEYTKIHFAVEETLMRIFDFDGYEAHKAVHDKIVQQVLIYQKKFMAGDDKVGMELLMFLKSWLFEHINKVDKQYVAILQDAGVKKSWLKKFW